MGGWWRWALVSPDGVAPSWMVSVSASVNLPLHHKVQKFSSDTGSRGWSRKKDHKMVVCGCGAGTSGQTILSKGCIAGGDFSTGKFTVTLDCFCSLPIEMLVDSMRGNPDAEATGNGAQRHAGNPNVIPLKNAASHGGSGPTSNTYFVGPR